MFPGEPFSFSGSHATLCSPTAGQSGRPGREFQTSQGPPQAAQGIHGPSSQVFIHLEGTSLQDWQLQKPLAQSLPEGEG